MYNIFKKSLILIDFVPTINFVLQDFAPTILVMEICLHNSTVLAPSLGTLYTRTGTQTSLSNMKKDNLSLKTVIIDYGYTYVPFPSKAA